MSNMIVLNRAVKIGSTLIKDPNPQMGFSDWIKSLMPRFPQLRSYKLLEEDANLEGETLVWVVPQVPPKTKG